MHAEKRWKYIFRMCGIVGYIGPNQPSNRPLAVVLEGLNRLEYRGYDSAGVAVTGAAGLEIAKRSGRVAGLEELLSSSPLPDSVAAIGHTRWATHGAPSDINAHPHVSPDGEVAIVHNGIIENHAVLRAGLLDRGHTFVSETDSEVAAHLLGEAFAKSGDLAAALLEVVNQLEGSFTLVGIAKNQTDRIVAARRNSPLVVGLGDGENFLGSDVAAFVGHTRTALAVDQDQLVTLTADSVQLVDFAGNPVAGETYEVDWNLETAMHDGYDTFMEKEINEQPTAVAETLRGRLTPDGRLQLDEMHISEDELRGVDKIIVVACGTASYAGQVAKYAIEHWVRIPVEVELAHEFRYRDPVLNERTLVVAISQSGETMDTLMAVRYAKEHGARVLGIINTYGSTIAREADAVLYTHAGPEIAVASTKAFTAQITACYLLGLYLSELKGLKSVSEISGYLAELEEMPGRIEQVLESNDEVKALAARMKDVESVIFLGRHVGYPIALEGALKLKEIAYVHAEGFAAGELKHGPIALVEEGLPIFFIVPTPRRAELHAKVVSNIAEVQARGAYVIAIAEEGDTAVEEIAKQVIHVPADTPTLMMPLVTVVPLQMFACALATEKGYDVDKPRNLAKSVTVE